MGRDTTGLCIYIGAESPRLEMIRSRLSARDVVSKRFSEDAPLDSGLLIDLTSASDAARRRAARMQALDTGVVVTLGHRDAATSDGVIHLVRERDLDHLPERLSIRRRARLREAEAALRLQSAREWGVTSAARPDAEEGKILYLGGMGPGFLALKAELKRLNVEMVAAISVRTAEAYLRDAAFGAVVLGAVDPTWIARLGVSGALDRQPLISAPAPGRAPEPNAAAYAPPEANAEARAQIVFEALWGHLNTLDFDQAPGVIDRATGVHAAAFFEHHLVNQIASHRSRGTAMSLLRFQVERTPDLGDDRRRCEALARTLSKQVRDTDFVGRLDWTSIAVSCPSTTYSGAARLANRLQAVVEPDVHTAILELNTGQATARQALDALLRTSPAKKRMSALRA